MGPMGGRPPLHLVSPATCQETVAVLREKLQQAEKGDLIGVALVCVYKPDGHSTEITGIIKRAPIFTMGALLKLIHKLESI